MFAKAASPAWPNDVERATPWTPPENGAHLLSILGMFSLPAGSIPLADKLRMSHSCPRQQRVTSILGWSLSRRPTFELFRLLQVFLVSPTLISTHCDTSQRIQPSYLFWSTAAEHWRCLLRPVPSPVPFSDKGLPLLQVPLESCGVPVAQTIKVDSFC